MRDEAVIYDRGASVGIITLNRPERLNAINGSLLGRLMGKLREAREDRQARCIILTGAGRAFCAGEDLKETSGEKPLTHGSRRSMRCRRYND